MKKRGKREGYSVWNHLVYLLRGIWSSDRVLMVLMVLEALSIVITPYVAMYLPKIGVDLVAARADSGEAACILGGLTIVVMISQAVGNMASRGKASGRIVSEAITGHCCSARHLTVTMRLWRARNGSTNTMRRK